MLLGGLWGFAEATLFFVVPDILVGYVALRSPRRAAAVFLAVTVGALLGATLLYSLVAAGHDLDGVIAAVPGIRPGDLDAARSALESRGLAATLDGLVAGQPVKLYIDAAAGLRLPLVPLLAFVAVNRCLRVGLTGIVCSILGRLGREVVRAHAAAVTVLYAAFWAAVYLWYAFLRP